MKHYDTLVIGSGGGTKLVRPVANLGKKVAVIEKGRLGGTCLNHGCIPSKMLIHAADVAWSALDAHRYDIYVNGTITVDFAGLVDRVCASIDHDSESIAPLYDNDPNIDLYTAEAKFLSDSCVAVEGLELTADRIFIAVGARAHIPNIPGLAETPYMTYKEALRLRKQPDRMIIIGGGYIAVELGYFFGALGTEVHFVVRSSMVRNEDIDVQEEFQKVFSQRFPIHLKKVPERVDYRNGEFNVTLNTGEVLTGDALLVSTGVTPWTDTLGLENTSVTTDEKGFVQVDDRLKTSAPNIWALGDCVGRYLFRHSVNYEGEYLFRTVYKEPSDEPIVYPPVPHAIFSNPQIGGVGKTEQELQQEGRSYIVGFNPYAKSAMGSALRSEHGFAKLLFDAKSRKLLGAHIIGDEASNMVHMLIAFMYKEATLDDLLGMIYIHPALPEIVRNAARDARRRFHALDADASRGK